MLLGSSFPAREACGSCCDVTATAVVPSPAGMSLATGDGKLDSFCSNESSRSLASLAIRLFLVGSARAAHMTAESADARLATSARSLSRSAAECSASSIAAGLFLVVPRNRPFPDSRDGAGNRFNSRSRPSAGPHAVMSVASRSSSPAIPTSVNSASDGHKSGQRPCVGGSPSLQSDTPANPRRSIRRRSARAPSSN